MDDTPAVYAVCRLKRRRIFEFLEMVLVRAIPDVHFSLDILAALLTVPPPTRMPFRLVRAAEGIAGLIAVTRIACKREKDVILLVVANPIATASRPRQWFRGRAAQTAAAWGSDVFGERTF
jgi:hypothetical protein